MDKIIWADGHTTTISSEEAFRRQYEVPTDNGSEWRMRIDDTEFAWHANCWMDISYQKKTQYEKIDQYYVSITRGSELRHSTCAVQKKKL